MLAGAFQQYLKAQGLSPVHVGGFGDYSAPSGPAWNVHAEAGADATHDGDTDLYPVRLQVRTRAANMIDAGTAGERAYARILAASGQTLTWTDERDQSTRRYEVRGVRAMQRPTWFATPEAGEETSCNFRLNVREL
jgi:hypothetical protein